MVCGVVLAGCQNATPPAPPRKSAVVKFAYPVEQQVTDSEEFTGRTEAVKTVEVRARVSGYLNDVYFQEGKEVKKGDLLFEIDPRPLQAEVDRAEANLGQAEAHQRRLQNDLRRAQEMVRSGAIGHEEFDRIFGDQAEAHSAVRSARAALAMARLNLEYSRVTSPLDGRISRRYVDPGNMVKADDTPLTLIVSADPMYATFDIDERTFLRIQRYYLEKAARDRAVSGWASLVRGRGRLAVAAGPAPYLLEAATLAVPVQAEVDMGLADEEGYPHKGKINFMDNRVDPSSVSVWVRGVFPNPHRLLTPGLFVRVRLPIGDPYRAILIPERALATDQGHKFVWVVKSVDNPQTGQPRELAEYRRVEVGEQHGRLRIVQGVKMGERVLVSGLQRVRADMEVTPQEEDPQEEQKKSSTSTDTLGSAK
jgi:RND family efflux transporter MFP subunit